MRTTLKARLSNLSIWIIVITIAIIILWLVAFIAMQVFDLKVFATKSTEFFYFMMVFAMVLIACAAALNIALSISIIADSKLQDIQVPDYKRFNLRFLAGFLAACALVIAFLFGGNFLSRESAKNRIILEAKNIIERYQVSVGRISEALSSTQAIVVIPETLAFLASQKAEISDVRLVVSSLYDGQRVFLEITRYSGVPSLSKPLYGHSFYKCDKEDAEYLTKVFEKKVKDPYYRSDSDGFLLYYPVWTNDKPFVLIFTKYDRYGKIGS